MKRILLYILLVLLVVGFALWKFRPAADAADDNTPLAYAAGQMMLVGFRGTRINDRSPIVFAIKHYHIGGVILFAREGGKTRNIKNPKQLLTLTKKLQAYAKKYHLPPLFIAVNQEGGRVNNLLTKKGFKLGANDSQLKLGKTGDAQSVYQQALYRGRLLKKYGINLDLAPVAALNLNLKSKVISKLERTYGNDPTKVTQYLAAAIKGYHDAHIYCAVKHFPGLGNVTEHTDYKAVDMTDTWQQAELTPYERLIRQKTICDFIMTAHAVHRGLAPSERPVSLSEKVVTGLLRNQLGYRGLIITDDMNAKPIRQKIPLEVAVYNAVMAGNDILLYGGTLGATPKKENRAVFHALLRLAYKDKKMKAKMLEAYKKIIDVKQSIQHSHHIARATDPTNDVRRRQPPTHRDKSVQ